MTHYDDLETRSADIRARDLKVALQDQVGRAQRLAGYAETLGGVDAQKIGGVGDLAGLPVLRKSDLGAAQKAHPPLGGFTTGVSQFSHVFQSPGPIYEPGSHDS